MEIILFIALVFVLVLLLKAKKDLKRVGKVDEYCKFTQELADRNTEKIGELEERKKDLEKSMKEYRNQAEEEMALTELNLLVGMVRVDEYEGLKSDEVKNRLAMLHSQQDELVKSGDALSVTNTIAKKSELNSQKKQILRCFNAECKSIIEGVTVKNIDTTRAKIQRTFEAINKIFAVDGVQISQKYLSSKYEELSMVYAYMVKEDEEREQRRAIREQMVEEEKVRREIEQARKKIEKEEAQFSNEREKLILYMQKAKDDVERKLYVDKISELEEKLKAIS